MDKITFDYYYNIVYFIAAFLALILSLTLEVKPRKEYTRSSNILSILVLFSFFILFGSRSLDVGSDTGVYKIIWDNLSIAEVKTDIMIYIIMYIEKTLGLSFQIFLYTIAAIYTYCFYFFFRKISLKYKTNIYLSIFCLVSLFFFKSLGINIIRQGISLCFFLLFVLNFKKLKKIDNWYFAILAVLTHTTSIIPILIFLAMKYLSFIKDKFLYLFYIISIILSFFSFSFLYFKEYISDFIDSQRSTYISGEETIYEIGFKPQFVLFNTIFLILSVFIKRYIKKHQLNLDNYDILAKYYLLMSSIFFLSFQIPYSDRIGVMSWIIIPLLVSPVYSTKIRKGGLKLLSTIFFMSIYIFFMFYE